MTHKSSKISPLFVSKKPEGTAGDLVTFFKEYGIIKELLGISDQCVVSLYALGHQMYQASKYKEAEQIFSLLCLFNHLERKYWLGLGAVKQMQKEYEKAIEAYGYAVLLDYKEPDAHLYGAQCLLALGKKKETKPILQNVLELSIKKEHQDIKEKAKSFLAILQ